MKDSGILKITGVITDFSIWDDTINQHALIFHKQHNVYPNILLASDFTYRKIDLYAQMHPDRIRTTDDNGNTETLMTSDVPYDGLSQFVAEDYILECCIKNDLPEGSFTFIFDEAPDFDGEPVEKPDEPANVYTYRKIA